MYHGTCWFCSQTGASGTVSGPSHLSTPTVVPGVASFVTFSVGGPPSLSASPSVPHTVARNPFFSVPPPSHVVQPAPLSPVARASAIASARPASSSVYARQ